MTQANDMDNLSKSLIGLVQHSPLTNGLLTQTDLDLATQEQTYYRSKIFTSHIGINPLIAAAAPLFSTAQRLSSAQESPNLETLRNDLIHEIKAFENRAQTAGYLSQIILMARFSLCAWLDEVLLKTNWGEYNWRNYLLLTETSHNHANVSSQFFSLLNRCSQDPGLYIDLLELIYLCLSFGYTGEYRYLENGFNDLHNITNNLYYRIRQQRNDVSKQLEIAVTDKTRTNLKTRQSRTWLQPTLATVSVAFLLMLVYFFMDYELKIEAAPIYQALHTQLEVVTK